MFWDQLQFYIQFLLYSPPSSVSPTPQTSAPHTITQIHVNETRGLVPEEYNCGSRLKKKKKNNMPVIITRAASLNYGHIK